jgi:hypothetical protein
MIAGAAAAEHDASVKDKRHFYGTTKRTVRMQLLRTEI